MADICLDALPKELICSIAVNSDALSILRLSQTSQTIRSACYDSLVFRELLKNRSDLWDVDSLDFEAIDRRCGKDASLWAKYAVADQKASELSQKKCPLEIPENFLAWLPELFVVRHPYMYQQCWGRFMWEPYQLTTRQMFCLTMAILAQPHDSMQQLEKSLAMHEDDYLRRDETSKGYLWGLCYMMLKVRKLLRTRRAAWPYNSAAHVPYIPLPTATELDMRPVTSSYDLPLPFADNSARSLNWDSWYFRHSREVVKAHLFEGTWNGYYTYFRSFFSAMNQLDPPMVQIKFVQRQSAADHDDDEDEVEIISRDCKDGVGPFGVVGRVSHVDDAFTFCGFKAYGDDITDGMRAGVTWNWKLKCTPFGLVGYWGIAQEDDELERNGCVWLWKTQS